MSDRGQDWYTNKELFESINDLKDDITETRHLIKHYNGLYESVKVNNNDIQFVKEEVLEVNKEINRMNHEYNGRANFINAVIKMSGWLVAIVGFFISYLM